MGHTRLGAIPKSRKWTAVVATISATGNAASSAADGLIDRIPEIAEQTLEAAASGLQTATRDEGVHFTMYLLTQIALKSRDNNWLRELQGLGLRLNETSSVVDLTVELQAAIDDYISTNSRPTDVSEIAQQAAGEAVAALTINQAQTLFGTGAENLRLAVRNLSTKKGFSVLSREFFANFMTRFLGFYLSRVTASQAGSEHLPQVGDLSRFDDALRLHCYQSARIVETYSGEWYSKTEYMEGISLENSANFVKVAFKKLQAELKVQGSEA